MAISHPARHYLYYRFSRNTDLIAKILTDFGDLRLPIPQAAKEFDVFVRKLLAFRKAFAIPSGFNPVGKPLNRQTLDFLKKWRISGMWLRESAVCHAEDILHEPMLRNAIEIMLLGPVSPAAIAERMRARYQLPESVMNVQIVRAYAHYFWDYTALTPSQWLTTIYDWLPPQDKTALLSAVNAPRTPAGAQLVMSVADGNLDSVAPAELYDTVRAMGYRMFMQHALIERASMARTQGALAAFQIMLGAGAEADKYRGGDSNLLKEFDRLETAFDKPHTASLHDLPVVNEPLALPSNVVAAVDSTAEEL